MLRDMSVTQNKMKHGETLYDEAHESCQIMNLETSKGQLCSQEVQNLHHGKYELRKRFYCMPLPIVQPFNPNEDQLSFLIIKAYPICHEWYHYHNIIVASCGHTYHCFCFFSHFQGSTKCVLEFFHSRVLHPDWWVNMGISPLTT